MHYSRLFGLPIQHDQLLGPELLHPGMAFSATRQPIEKVLIRERPGVYIAFDYVSDAAQLMSTILDAVQWTAPDGTYWTIQGVLPRDELIALADEVYQPVVFEASDD